MIYKEFTSESALERLRGINAFLLDMDGTFYLGERILDGSLDFLNWVHGTGRKALFLTNNSSRSAKAYERKLARMGVPREYAAVYTSGNAAAQVLLREYAGKRVYVAGTDEFARELEADGINVHFSSAADVLLLSYDTTLTYEKLCAACRMARAGLPYIATHPDFNCPSEEGPLPDIGSFIELIYASTGRRPDMVIGKPQRGIVDNAMSRLRAHADETCMVGDRLYTDIAAGKNAGILSVCVLTGEAAAGDIRASVIKPDVVADCLADLTTVL
jgi:HAD superfamily hydrolase (TIGR01450 family)